MIRRRQLYNALVRSHEPRWLVHRSMHRTVLDVRRLEPGTDLVRVFLETMLELLNAGWQLGEFSSAAAHVHYSRASEQRMLAIEVIEPGRLADGSKRDGGASRGTTAGEADTSSI